MKKIIVARLSVKADALQQFLPLANNMVELSNEEKGNQFYRMYQALDCSSDIIVYEEYENLEAIEFHNNSDHFNYFLDKVKPMLRKEPQIEII